MCSHSLQWYISDEQEETSKSEIGICHVVMHVLQYLDGIGCGVKCNTVEMSLPQVFIIISTQSLSEHSADSVRLAPHSLIHAE